MSQLITFPRAAAAVGASAVAVLAFVAGSATAAAPTPAPVAPPPVPTRPFTVVRGVNEVVPVTKVLGPVTGKVAITHVTTANLGTAPVFASLYTADVDASGRCPLKRPEYLTTDTPLGIVAVPASATVVQPFTTPMVLTPRSSRSPKSYCVLLAQNESKTLTSASVSVTGFTVSGSTTTRP
jgi:hypothetical protein